MHKLLILPAFVVVFLACSGQREAASNESVGESKPQTVMSRYGGPDRADSLVLSLERTPCFGTCKAYRLAVYRSGYATYEGRAHVEKMGPHSARIGTDSLGIIVRLAEKHGFFGMEDKYDADVTDLPSTQLRIVADGKDKKVLARVGQPPAFKELVSELETLLLPVAWKPVPAER